MPNNTRIPLCPYYRDEKNKSISCEDIFRGFDSRSAKYSWMDNYCCTDWEACEYAARLNAMYDRIFDEGADMETEKLKEQNEAYKKELRYKATQLGRVEKRLEAKEEEIKKLRKKNHDEYDKRREAEKALEKNRSKLLEQMQTCIDLYKDALCYLLSLQPEQKILEADIETWIEDKHPTVVRLYDAEGRMTWKLDFYEREEEEDGNCNDIQDGNTEEEEQVRQSEVQA